MARKDLWSSLFWILFGVGILSGALSLPLGEFHNPGPGFMPLLVGGLIIILALVLLGRSLRTSTVPPAESLRGPGPRLWKLIGTVISLVAYVILFPTLGFFLTTLFLTVFLFKAIGDLRWSVSLASGVGTAILFYLLFKVWLGVQVPAGFLGL